MASTYQLALDGEWDKLKNFYDNQNVFALSFPQTAAGDTAFHLAVFSKRNEPLKSFLKLANKDPSFLKIAKEDSTTESPYSAKNIYGNTALHEAAAVGNIEAVKLLVDHDKKLLEVRNKEGETPLFKAAAYGQTKVVHYLASEFGRMENGTELKDIDRNRVIYMMKKPEANKPPVPNQREIIEVPGSSILHAAIQGEHFDTALALLELDESLATLENENGMTSLQLLATMPSAFRSRYRMSIWKRLLYFCAVSDPKRRIRLPIPRRILKEKRKHELALKLTRTLIDQDTTWQQIVDKNLFEEGEGEGSGPISKPIALFLATEKGIVEIVKMIRKQTPQLVEYVDDMNQNILHIAIMHRRKELFNLVKEMNIPMKRLVRGIDKDGYTTLHHAADMTNDNADIHRGPAYHLQEELKWYKRVEKLAPSHFAMFRVIPKDDNKDEKNDHNKEEKKDCNNKEKKSYNCKELFDLKHNELLKEAQKWVKETSQSCSAVAVLVATVVFAAAYTVPGGSNDKGYPVFLNNNFFLVFTVMDVVALACSLTSVVMFLSVLNSPFSYEEFRHRLPRKLTAGFSLLFIALTTTMLAFAATLLLIVRFQRPRWTTTLIYTAAFFPVSIFALTQFPMYVAFKLTFLKFYKWIKKILPRKRCKKTWATRFQCCKKNDDLPV